MSLVQSEHQTAKGGESMKLITKIEPSSTRPAMTKIRAAAYCRVSTGMDDQLVSLETQKSHYENIRQASAGCLSSPQRNKALPPIFTMIFSP